MNTQHTPGPWHVNAISENRVVGDETAEPHTYSKLTINNSNATIATVYRARDARLIAAAPDLLAQRDALLEALQKIANGEGYYGAQAAEYKAIARAAIAKVAP